MSDEPRRQFSVTISNFGDIDDQVLTGMIPLEELTKAYVLAAMSSLNGNLTETSRRLRIGRTTLYRMLDRWEKKR